MKLHVFIPHLFLLTFPHKKNDAEYTTQHRSFLNKAIVFIDYYPAYAHSKHTFSICHIQVVEHFHFGVLALP